jgi:hypothetical protein
MEDTASLISILGLSVPFQQNHPEPYKLNVVCEYILATLAF